MTRRIKKTLAELEQKRRRHEEKEKRVKAEIAQSNERALKERRLYEADVAVMKKEIHRLKTMIDFKALSNIFHASKQMSIVKEHRESFVSAFQNDDEAILRLLDEAKMSNEDITTLIKDIRKRREGLKPPETRVTQHVASRSFHEEKRREERRLEKARREREALVASIKEKLGGMGVILETGEAPE